MLFRRMQKRTNVPLLDKLLFFVIFSMSIILFYYVDKHEPFATRVPSFSVSPTSAPSVLKRVYPEFCSMFDLDWSKQ